MAFTYQASSEAHPRRTAAPPDRKVSRKVFLELVSSVSDEARESRSEDGVGATRHRRDLRPLATARDGTNRL